MQVYQPAQLASSIDQHPLSQPQHISRSRAIMSGFPRLIAALFRQFNFCKCITIRKPLFMKGNKSSSLPISGGFGLCGIKFKKKGNTYMNRYRLFAGFILLVAAGLLLAACGAKPSASPTATAVPLRLILHRRAPTAIPHPASPSIMMPRCHSISRSSLRPNRTAQP